MTDPASELSFQGPTRPSRPILVITTQVLLGLVILLQIYAVITGMIALARGSSVSPGQVVLAYSATALVLGLAVILSVGLARARRWAWHGSVLFALLVLVLVFYSRAHPSVPRSGIPDDQLLGAAAAELMVTLLVVLYPIRVYFSKKFRAFLGV